MFCKSCLNYITGTQRNHVIHNDVSTFCCRCCLGRYLKELTTDKSMYRRMRLMSHTNALSRCANCVQFERFLNEQIEKRRKLGLRK